MLERRPGAFHKGYDSYLDVHSVQDSIRASRAYGSGFSFELRYMKNIETHPALHAILCTPAEGPASHMLDGVIVNSEGCGSISKLL